MVAVLVNINLNQATGELRVMGGSTQVPTLPASARRRLRHFCLHLGLHAAQSITRKKSPAWNEAIAAIRPSLIAFRTDPPSGHPTMPPGLRC